MVPPSTQLFHSACLVACGFTTTWLFHSLPLLNTSHEQYSSRIFPFFSHTNNKISPQPQTMSSSQQNNIELSSSAQSADETATHTTEELRLEQEWRVAKGASKCSYPRAQNNLLTFKQRGSGFGSLNSQSISRSL